MEMNPSRNRTGKIKIRSHSGSVERAEQLRVAKRAQRNRDRQAGFVEARLKLPAALARRLAFASRQKGFRDALVSLLEAETVEISKYPQLQLLCWNRKGMFVGSRDAWEMYERNWRFVDHGRLTIAEKELIRELVHRFGSGVMNV
jgi:hypothetical protein